MNVDTCSLDNYTYSSEDSEDFIDGIIDEVSDFIINDDNSSNIFKRIFKKIKKFFYSCIPL